VAALPLLRNYQPHHPSNRDVSASMYPITEVGICGRLIANFEGYLLIRNLLVLGPQGPPPGRTPEENQGNST